jgi:hypothetical protein
MPADPRKRQRKLERQSGKRKDKKHALAKASSVGLASQLAAAAKFPPLDTWIGETLWTEGLGMVLFSRAMPDGSVAVAMFLVDRFCLGVKNALAKIVGRFTYESEFTHQMRSQSPIRTVSPATARKLVEQAVAYAHDLGFHPHRDYQKAKFIFGDVDAAASTEEFEFGKDGRPFFIAGPDDTPERCRQIVATIAKTQGPGEFDAVMPVRSAETGLLEGDE